MPYGLHENVELKVTTVAAFFCTNATTQKSSVSIKRLETVRNKNPKLRIFIPTRSILFLRDTLDSSITLITVH